LDKQTLETSLDCVMAIHYLKYQHCTGKVAKLISGLSLKRLTFSQEGDIDPDWATLVQDAFESMEGGGHKQYDISTRESQNSLSMECHTLYWKPFETKESKGKRHHRLLYPVS